MGNPERSRIGEERFRREHECEFIIYDETLIDSLKSKYERFRSQGEVDKYVGTREY